MAANGGSVPLVEAWRPGRTIFSATNDREISQAQRGMLCGAAAKGARTADARVGAAFRDRLLNTSRPRSA